MSGYMNIEDIECHERATRLYDGGWRSGDLVRMVEHYSVYGMTMEEGKKLCKYLAEFEKDKGVQ